MPKFTKQTARKAGQLSSRSSEIMGKASRKDLARLTEYGMKKARTWMDRVADDNPAAALRILTGLLEYTHPKLSRRESLNVAANLEITVEEREALIQKIAEAHNGNG